MSKKEKDVELIPNPPSGWKVKHGSNVGTNPGNYPKVEFAPNSGPHLVVFKLQDVPGAGGNPPITPTFDANDPMWIQQGSTSPTAPGMDPQITDWAIFDGGKTLVVLDSNTQAGDLSYRVEANGYSPPLDPIIRNGGTTYPPPYSTTEFLIGGAALLVAFLVGMFVQRAFLAK